MAIHHQPTDVKAAASQLSRNGYRIFPLKPDGKTPLSEGWQKSASADPERASRLWGDTLGFPCDRNIGVATGGDLVVLDVDVKNGKGGLTALQLLDLQGLPLDTFTVTTPTGGKHLYYRHPRANDIRNRTATYPLGHGIDVRSRGGYVVGPGSTIGGVPYAVENAAEPVELPQWAFDILLADSARGRPDGSDDPPVAIDLDKPVNVEAARDWLEARAPVSLQGEGGDATAFWTAARCGDFGLSEATVLDLMLEAWNERCEPPWDAEELAQKVHNAFRYRDRPIGADAPSEAATRAAADFEVLEGVGVASGMDGDGASGTGGADGLPFTIRNSSQFEWSTDQTYLVYGLLSRGMVGLVAGKTNAGKSPLMLDLCARLSTGQPFMGRDVERGYCLYVAAEGWTGLSNRMEALRRQYFADAEPGSVPMDFASIAFNLRDPASARKVIQAVQVRAARFGVPPAAIVFDTLSQSMGGGDENNPEHVRAVLLSAKKIAAATGAAVLFVHHPTKDGGSDFRGSSILLNDADVLINVHRDQDTGVSVVTTPRTKEWGEIEPVQFRIHVDELGETPKGQKVTSVTIRWIDPVAEDFAVDVSPEESKYLDLARVLSETSTSGCFVMADMLDLLAKKGGSPTRKGVEKYLASLVYKGRIERVSRGVYRAGDAGGPDGPDGPD